MTPGEDSSADPLTARTLAVLEAREGEVSRATVDRRFPILSRPRRPEEDPVHWRAFAYVREVWAQALARRWKVRGPGRKALAALQRLDDGVTSPDMIKAALVREALLLTLHDAREPWTGRLGSGEGSGKVTAVPAEAHVVGGTAWTEQEVLRRAAVLLRDWAAMPPEVPGDVRLPGAASAASVPAGAASPLEELVAAEARSSAAAVVSELLALASPQQRALTLLLADPETEVGPLRTPEEAEALAAQCETRADAARWLGIRPGAARTQLDRLREKAHAAGVYTPTA